MSCINPVHIQSPSNLTGKYIYVPCGRCAWCRSDKRNEWYVRFKIELRDSKFCKFITLTYSEDNLPFYLDEDTGEFGFRANKVHIQKFVKRMRKAGHKFKYFIVSEYAPKSRRPHYHGLLFTNDDISDEDVREHWSFGITDTQEADEGCLKYVTKYILKGNDRDGNFKLQSTRPAIGSGYIKFANAQQCRTFDNDTKLFKYHVGVDGTKYPLPRFYRKKFSQFYDELELFENNKRQIFLMENMNKYEHLEKLFNKKLENENILSPLEKNEKFMSSIRSKYFRDNNKQYDINNESKLE